MDKPSLARSESTLPAPANHSITLIGQVANRTAADFLFTDYRQRRAQKTIRTQTAALLLWVQYLREVGAAGELVAEAEAWASAHFDDTEVTNLLEYAQSQQSSLPIIYGAHFCQYRPEAWQGVTWGLVEGFVKWLLNQGYSLASVNNRLSAIKVYARLAGRAGVIPPTDMALIREVRGYGQTEGKRVDEARPKVRLGHKKDEAIVLTARQARRLKTEHPPTPQGIRDRLMLCLFLDLGLRASEVVRKIMGRLLLKAPSGPEDTIASSSVAAPRNPTNSSTPTNVRNAKTTFLVDMVSSPGLLTGGEIIAKVNSGGFWNQVMCSHFQQPIHSPTVCRLQNRAHS
ncbi:MAG: hypothetical protein KDE28_07765 [Anaerolineales bacterium]|nr:hypothetical protein [Anaerolineales bacterium]